MMELWNDGIMEFWNNVRLKNPPSQMSWWVFCF